MVSDNLKTTPSAAKAAGDVRYFTGKPCAKAGHIVPRYACDTSCVECVRIDYRRRKRRLLGAEPPTRPEPLNCELCERSRYEQKFALAADHCHETGAFRGWLCHRCNTALGRLGDNVLGIRRALAYLVNSRTST